MKLLKLIRNIFKDAKPIVDNLGEWHSAGILFTDYSSALVGYKVINSSWLIGGFGGKRKGNENYYQTAIRETFEEIYETDVKYNIINSIENRLKIKDILNNDGYILIICDFNELKKFMETAIQFGITSPVYCSLPNNAISLIGYRNNRYDCEYVYLGFQQLNMILSENSPVEVDPYLVSDIKYIKEYCEKHSDLS